MQRGPGCGDAGFYDHSEYEDAKRAGDDAIRRMIDRHLSGTSVTVILIGQYTAASRWVQCEIKKSVEQDNGLLGVHLNLVGSPKWTPFFPGPVPHTHGTSCPTFTWKEPSHTACVAILKKWIEEAGQRSDFLRALHGRR